jgi:hypothetical protein
MERATMTFSSKKRVIDPMRAKFVGTLLLLHIVCRVREYPTSNQLTQRSLVKMNTVLVGQLSQ